MKAPEREVEKDLEGETIESKKHVRIVEDDSHERLKSEIEQDVKNERTDENMFSPHLGE